MATVNRRGKVFALSTVAVGLVVMVAAGIILKPWIVEEYYIQRMRASDVETSQGAVEALADAQSVRSVPYLIALLKLREDTCFLVSGRTEEYSVVMTPLAFALYRIGKGALPSLGRAKKLEEQRMLEEEGSIHFSSNEYLGILYEISSCIESPDQVVREEPYDSDVWNRQSK